jgi:hypothetical protein
MRGRSDHLTFVQKLRAEKARIEAELEKTNPGQQHELLERKLSQIETAFEIDRWASSPELQPPK